jgi:hypothetical protein
MTIKTTNKEECDRLVDEASELLYEVCLRYIPHEKPTTIKKCIDMLWRVRFEQVKKGRKHSPSCQREVNLMKKIVDIKVGGDNGKT